MGELRTRGQRVTVADGELAHLFIVVRRRFAEHGSFPLTWTLPTTEGSGRRTIFLAPQVPVSFHFRHDRQQQVDGDGVRRMLAASYQAGGVQLADVQH